MFAGPSRIQLIKKNISPKKVSIKINRPKIQPEVQEKLKYKHFIEMHRTMWKVY